MTDLDIMLSIEAAATPARWQAVHSDHDIYGSVIMDHNCGELMRTNSYGLMREDSLLIATMRNSFRELCTELGAAREVLVHVNNIRYCASKDLEHALAKYDEATK